MQILRYGPYSGTYSSNGFTGQQFNPWLSDYNYGGLQYPFNFIQVALPYYSGLYQYQDPMPSYLLQNYVIIITLF